MKALESPSTIKYSEGKREALVRSNPKILLGEEGRSPGVYKNDICTVKAQLEVVDKDRCHGAIVRARGENCCLAKRALGAEKRYASRNDIAEIKYCGALTSDCKDIERAFFDFYRRLFSYYPVDTGNFKSEFPCLLPQLDSETTTTLQAGITVGEVEKPIDDLNPGKSPGPGGLSAGFYKTFKHKISPVLCRVLREAWELKKATAVFFPFIRSCHS